MRTLWFLAVICIFTVSAPHMALADFPEKESEVEGWIIFKPISADRDTDIGLPISRMCHLVAFQDIHYNQACGCSVKPSAISKPHKPGLKYWSLRILADVNANGQCM